MDGDPLADGPPAPGAARKPRPEPLDGSAPGAPALPERAAPTWRRVLALAWPVLVQQLLILVVLLSDQLLVGYFQPGDPSQHVSYQAAQTNALYLNWFVNSFTYLVSIGSTALVARFVGAGDRAAAVRAANQSVLLAVLVGLAGTAAGLAAVDGGMALLGLHGATHEFAVGYLRPLFVFLTFQVVQSAGVACLVGAGDTRTGMWVLGGVAVLNVPLAWLLFHGAGPVPRLGFPGISLGTALANTAGCLAVLIVLVRGRAGLRLRWRLLRPDPDLLRRLLRVSVPAAADSLAAGVGQLWFLRVVNRLGDVAGSAHGIALRLEGLGFLSGHAFGTAAMALVGQNLGARRPDRAAHSGWVAFGLGCGVMSVMGAVFFALARPMFGLICPNPEQREVIDVGVPVLRLVAFAMPPLASTIIFTSALRGAGDTRVPVLFTLLGLFAVRIPLAYLFTLDRLALGPLGDWPALGLGLFGAWLAMFADLVVRGAFFFYRFAGGRWQGVRV